jgi:endonuclease/exonuclease/phosphatase family metal-dependent hydrolase
MNRLSPPRTSATFLALGCLLFSCAPDAKKPDIAPTVPRPPVTNAVTDAATIRLGTWNIEHFGSRSKFQNRSDSPPDRTPAEFAKVAEFIKQMQTDVLALQEIDSPAILHQLLQHLGDDYRFALGTTGVYGKTRISVGFLWNRQRVQLLHCEEMSQFPSKVGDLTVFHRKPVNAAFRAIHPDGRPGFDFRAITVHLKASTGDKNERKRSTEAKVLSEYLRKLAQDPEEDQDIVVLGDFNHTYGAPACKEFTSNDLVEYVRPANNGAMAPTIVWFDEPIDHIALTKGIRDHVQANSHRIHNQEVDWKLKGDALTASKALWRQTYSDHFPVSVELQSGTDLDPNAKFSSAGKSLQIGK